MAMTEYTPRNNERPNGKGPRTNDPQLVVEGTVKTTASQTEIITFSIHLALFEIVCIVNIPGDGETTAPVYVKFKTHFPRKRPEGGFRVRSNNGDRDDSSNEDLGGRGDGSGQDEDRY